MQVLKKKLNLNKLEYYKTHLSLVNCLLPVKMTPKEIEVLAGFMGLEGDIAKHRFGKTARKLIMEELNLSPSGLSNYIKSLSDNRFLIEDEAKELNIWPVLIPEPDEQEYQFKIVKVNINTNTNEQRQARENTSKHTVRTSDTSNNRSNTNRSSIVNGHDTENEIIEKSNVEIVEE